ncbi:MAG TPA: DUF1549 and DUF1553 domain-containing protein [Chthonomonadaceae bacterium]|nr:DUF1549 and DUF1553 domain-containing protein [Chthonomonadaceae bacterium]
MPLGSWSRTLCIPLLATMCGTASAAPRKPATPPPPRPVSFINDVVPVLTRAGCNAGACHGAAAGKGGFKLSLRGYAPEIDYAAMARLGRGRRVDTARPEASLVLRKPLLEIPHRGGMAIKPGSVEYSILSRWLHAGAPPPDLHDPHVVSLRVLPAVQSLAPHADTQLHVEAQFSDGSRRDVTHWTRFGTNDENVATAAPEGKVHVTGCGQTSIMVGYQDRVAVATILAPFPNRVDPKAYRALPRSNYIDDRVYSRLAALRLFPSKPASDLEFVRRVTLDLTGSLPSPAEVRAFAADREPGKRAKLVDSLIGSPRFIDFWTYKWSDLLRVNRGTLKDKGMWAYHSYIHDAVRDNKGWDQISREVLTARGNTFLDGPANYFRTALKPEELAENVSQGFLGIRMQCAKCHNHPLEKWTQNEYYGMANLFARTKFKADLSIYVNDEMTVYNVSSGDLVQPRLGRPVPPKPLGGPELALSSSRERRAYFADWLTRPDNWYFSHSIVNRVWAHFMGKGLVEPVDDLRETNPASNPELFDALAADFVKHNYDLRRLMRTIVTSQAYQLSSTSTPLNAPDDRYYSHFLVRRMTAEELLDALSDVTGNPEAFPGTPAGLRAIQLPDTKVKSDFMDVLGRPPRVITCECERSQEPNMAQALLFINGELINRKVSADNGTVDRLIKAGKGDAEILDTLYWTALGRAPRALEKQTDLAAIRKVCAAAEAPAAPPLAANRQATAPSAVGSGASAAPRPAAAPAAQIALRQTPGQAPATATSRPAQTAVTPPRVAPDAAAAAAARRHAFEDMYWALLNSKEFLFNH